MAAPVWVGAAVWRGMQSNAVWDQTSGVRGRLRNKCLHVPARSDLRLVPGRGTPKGGCCTPGLAIARRPAHAAALFTPRPWGAANGERVICGANRGPNNTRTHQSRLRTGTAIPGQPAGPGPTNPTPTPNVVRGAGAGPRRARGTSQQQAALPTMCHMAAQGAARESPRPPIRACPAVLVGQPPHPNAVCRGRLAQHECRQGRNPPLLGAACRPAGRMRQP
jgi:hypothetical protein